MKIIEKKTSDLIPYENNPRHNDNAVEAVANSIKTFGFKVPIVIDKNNIIVAGHTRLKAALSLGMDKVPCIVADDLSDDQVAAFRLADNKTSELAEWDYYLLDEELKKLQGIIDMERFGFEEMEAEISEADDTYTSTIDIPKYEPQMENAPDVETLTDLTKYNDLIAEINASKLPKQDKEFLKLAASRHIVFDYKKIAEYYAHASAELQDLMEKSALVIIDYDKAIEYGYAKIRSEIDEMREAIEDNDDE